MQGKRTVRLLKIETQNKEKTMAKKQKIVSGNIAPLNTDCIAIHSMCYNPDERCLYVTLKTNDENHPLQDFKYEWYEDEFEGEVESFYYSYQLCEDPKAPNGQDWWGFDLDEEMPEPKNPNELSKQRKYIDKYQICHWGGQRDNAGRKGQNTKQVSSSIPPKVLEAIQEAAKRDNSSLSAKICEILKNWARRQKKG